MLRSSFHLKCSNSLIWYGSIEHIKYSRILDLVFKLKGRKIYTRPNVFRTICLWTFLVNALWKICNLYHRSDIWKINLQIRFIWRLPIYRIISDSLIFERFEIDEFWRMEFYWLFCGWRLQHKDYEVQNFRVFSSGYQIVLSVP